MTKEEMRSRITEIMDEALKIEKLKDLSKDMDQTMKRTDLSETSRDALVIGYAALLRNVYRETQSVWLHLYDLRNNIAEEEAKDDTAV